MGDIGGVKQALVQTQAVERLQEAARRTGDQQQQGFAVTLNRQVDDRESKVTEKEKASQEELDPNAKRKQEEKPRAAREAAEAEKDPAEPGWDDEEEDRGRHVDTRA
jgi:hypothetical protein